MNYVDSDMVKEYIENEKNYIKEDILNEQKYHYDIRGLEEDIHMLENLTEEDIRNITQKINDDEELQDKINELIHYWIYHR